MIDYKVDKAKAKASLLYVAANIPNVDRHKLYKILYFAEQIHLIRYGKPITGDAYIKMDYGPVPSYIKDKVEKNRDPDDSVISNGIYVVANEYPDMDELSESDIECLDESISANRDKKFAELTRESHKQAWNEATFAGVLDPILIAKEGQVDDGMVQYIQKGFTDSSLIR